MDATGSESGSTLSSDGHSELQLSDGDEDIDNPANPIVDPDQANLYDLTDDEYLALEVERSLAEELNTHSEPGCEDQDASEFFYYGKSSLFLPCYIELTPLV
jgi:hypothetical protein